MTRSFQRLQEAELFGDEDKVDEVLDDLFLMQAPNNPDDEETLPPTGGVLTPIEVYVGPEVELISLGEHTPDLVHCRPFAERDANAYVDTKVVGQEILENSFAGA